MTKINLLKKAVLLSGVAVISFAATAHAGFEWKGPLEPPHAAPEAAPAPTADDNMMPVTAVSPDAAPVAPVTSPEIAVEPVQHAAPGTQTAMAATAAPAEGVLSGFGSDLPLVIALQQIVPPGHQYSFSGGVNPGVTVSWQGGKPWQHVLSDTLAPQGLGYSLNNNTVIISRSSAPAAAAPAVMEGPDSSMSPAPDLSPAHTGHAAPAAQENLAPVSITSQPPVMDAAPAAEASPAAAPEAVNIRREKPSSLLDRLGWRRDGGEQRTEGTQAIVSQPPVKTSHNYTSETASAPGAAAPSAVSAPPAMSEPPAAEPAPVVASAATPSSSADAAFSSGAHMEMASAAKSPAATVSSSWAGGKGQTLRDVLKAWSDKAGVELYWSIDYDYRLADDASFTGSYDEAVGGLLDKFASVRPQPYGQLHQSSSGPRVLVVKSYDLTR